MRLDPHKSWGWARHVYCRQGLDLLGSAALRSRTACVQQCQRSWTQNQKTKLFRLQELVSPKFQARIPVQIMCMWLRLSIYTYICTYKQTHIVFRFRRLQLSVCAFGFRMYASPYFNTHNLTRKSDAGDPQPGRSQPAETNSLRGEGRGRRHHI